MSLADCRPGGRLLLMMGLTLGKGVGAARVVLLAGYAAACASGTTARDPVPLATGSQPVQFESNRGPYNFEFLTEQVITVDTLQVAPEIAWAVVHRAYTDLGLPAGETREGTTTYGVPRASVRRSLAGVPLSRFLRCGATMGVQNADNYDVTLSLITRLVPLPPAATIVQSQLIANARQTGVASNPLPCATTRDLERRVSRLIEFHAANR